MTAQPDPLIASAAGQHCATCGRLLSGEYYMLVDRPERYCSQCIATRPRCDNCGAPIGADSWRLHDDRLQCPRCHSTAIYEPQVSRQIYRETVGYVVAQLGLALNVGVEFRLVDAPTLRSIRAQDSDYSPSASERTLGLYQRQGRLRAIYLLYGIPRLLFRTTVAHEYAHAWQGENCPLLHDKFLIEGFAEWVAYRHLVWLGCTRAADRMLNSRHPYRPALEHALSLESYLGTAGLLDYIKRAE